MSRKASILCFVAALVLGVAVVDRMPLAIEVDIARLQQQAFDQAAKRLTSRDPQERREAAEHLGMHADRADAVVLLAEALADRDAGVREEAARSLWKLADRDASLGAATPALRTALSDPAAAVRVQAAGALEKDGADGAGLVDARRSVLADGDWFDVALAVRDLIGWTEPSLLVAPLLDALRRTPPSSDRDRFDAGDVLGALAGTGDRAVIAPMLAALAEPALPKPQLLEALGRFEPAPEGWVEALLVASRDPLPAVRVQAAKQLQGHAARTPSPATWTSDALHLLDDRDADVLYAACAAFAAAGGDAHPATDALLRIVASPPTPAVRRAAIDALAAIGDTAEAYDRDIKTAVAETIRPTLEALAADATLDRDTRGAVTEALKAMAAGSATGTRALALAPHGDAAALQRLRARGIEVTEDAFWRALGDRDVATVEDLLAAGRSARAPGDAGMPPVHFLVMGGCDYGRATAPETRSMLASLLAHGADPDQRDDNGNTALHRATSCDAELVRQLLAAGADPRARNGSGHGAFTSFVAVDTDAAQALLDAGFRFDAEEAAQLRSWLAQEGDAVKRRLLQQAGVR